MSVGMEMVERIKRHLERNGAAKTDLAGLLASWNIDVANREGRREVTDALAGGGVSVTPPLEDVEDPGAEVVLRLGDAKELMAARPAAAPPAPEPPAEPEPRAPEPPPATEVRAPRPAPAPEPPPAAEPRAPEPPPASETRTPTPDPPPAPEPRTRAPEPSAPPRAPVEPAGDAAAPPEDDAAAPPAKDTPPAESGGAKEQAGAALRGLGRGAGALFSRGAGALRKDDTKQQEHPAPETEDRAEEPPPPPSPAPREPEPEPPSRWAEERKAAREAEAAKAAETEDEPPPAADEPPKGRRGGGLWARTGLPRRDAEQPTDEDDSISRAQTQVAPEPAAEPAAPPPEPRPPKEKLFVASEIGRDLGRTAIPMLAIGAATVMISLILPWYEAIGGSPSDSNVTYEARLGWEWLEIFDIYLMLMSFGAVGVAALVFQRQTRFAALLGRLVLVLGVVGIVVVMIRMANPPFDTLNGFKLDVETKIGPFVALVGTVLTTIGVVSPAQVGIERLLGEGGDPVSFVKRDGPAAEPTAEDLAEMPQQPQRRS